MNKIVEKVVEDLSTQEVFLFHVACAICNKAYANRPVRFSKSGVTPATKSKAVIYEALYEQERAVARQSAVGEAATHLNYCPICKRLVCDQCFLICEDLDMCRQCAEELNEKGKPVLSEVIAGD